MILSRNLWKFLITPEDTPALCKKINYVPYIYIYMSSAQSEANQRERARLGARGLSDEEIEQRIREMKAESAELNRQLSVGKSKEASARAAAASAHSLSAPAMLQSAKGAIKLGRSVQLNFSAIRGVAASAHAAAAAGKVAAAIDTGAAAIVSAAGDAAAELRSIGMGLARNLATVAEAGDAAVASAAGNALGAGLGAGVAAINNAKALAAALGEKGTEMMMSDAASKAALGSELKGMGEAAAAAATAGMAAAAGTAAEGIAAAKAIAAEIGEHGAEIAALGDLARKAFQAAGAMVEGSLNELLKMFDKPLYFAPGEKVYRLVICTLCGGGATTERGCGVLDPVYQKEVKFNEGFKQELEQIPGIRILPFPGMHDQYMVQNLSTLYPGRQLLQAIGNLYQAFRDKQVRAGLIAA